MSDRLRIAAAAFLIAFILLTPLACLAMMAPDPTATNFTTTTSEDHHHGR